MWGAVTGDSSISRFCVHSTNLRSAYILEIFLKRSQLFGPFHRESLGTSPIRRKLVLFDA